MGTSKITGLGDPTLIQDAATKNYVDTQDALKLSLSGGTMTGGIVMGANKVTSTATPTANDDLTRKGYVDSILGSATSAADSAAAAAISATNASNSASTASSSASSASSSAASAAASLDSFDDRYLGSKASAPTLDNDGNALLEGSLYWNSTSKILFVWDGASWQNASSFQVGGTASLIDGSASEPALRFSNDLDTGIYRHSDNSFSFTTGGTEAATFEDAGQTVFQLLSSGGDQLLNVDETTDDLLQVINSDDTVLFQVSNTTGVTSVVGFTGTTITGTSFASSGDMTFGDDDEAIFGSGGDLRIYHSFLGESRIHAFNNDLMLQAGNGIDVIGVKNDGRAELYFIGSTRLATSNTGIDVTGTVTADGLTVDGNAQFTSTGAVKVPVGTEAQRPTPATGQFRFNSDTGQFEGYNGTAWGSIGGGATGAGGDAVFIQNGQTVTTNYTIPADQNAMSTGPITINAGATVTVSTGARYVVI
jgi:hypothetical protein